VVICFELWHDGIDGGDVGASRRCRVGDGGRMTCCEVGDVVYEMSNSGGLVDTNFLFNMCLQSAIRRLKTSLINLPGSL
jgi:hypothetical protein